MLKWLIRRRLAAFERANDYDVSYVRDILDVDGRAALAFNWVAALAAYRHGIPPDGRRNDARALVATLLIRAGAVSVVSDKPGALAHGLLATLPNWDNLHLSHSALRGERPPDRLHTPLQHYKSCFSLHAN